MKKITSVLLLVVLLVCNIVGCDSKEEIQTKEIQQTQQIQQTTEPIDYKAAIACIDEAILHMHKCADKQQDWFLVTNNFPYLYSDSNYTGGNNENAKAAGTYCYNCRKDAKMKMEEAKSIIKGGSGEYFGVVQEYYLAASSYLDFISNVPEGHSKITWSQEWTNLRKECSSAAEKVSFYNG